MGSLTFLPRLLVSDLECSITLGKLRMLETLMFGIPAEHLAVLRTIGSSTRVRVVLHRHIRGSLAPASESSMDGFSERVIAEWAWE